MLLASAYVASAQQSTKDIPFNGLIITEEGYAVQKMKVQVKGRSRHAVSDKQGRFGLTNVPKDAVLNLSHKTIDDLRVPVLGRQSLRIVVADGQLADAQRSQELEDAGFFYVRKREQTASGVITGEELRRSNHTDLEAALMSRVSGLVKIDGRLQLRGFYSVNAEPVTLLLVDGMQVPDFSGVNIKEVESVTIHKDGSSVYGLRGFAGAIAVKLRSL